MRAASHGGHPAFGGWAGEFTFVKALRTSAPRHADLVFPRERARAAGPRQTSDSRPAILGRGRADRRDSWNAGPAPKGKFPWRTCSGDCRRRRQRSVGRVTQNATGKEWQNRRGSRKRLHPPGARPTSVRTSRSSIPRGFGRPPRPGAGIHPIDVRRAMRFSATTGAIRQAPV